MSAAPYWVPLGGTGVAYQAAWSSGYAYQPGDVVTYQGIQYMAMQPSTGQAPPAAVAGIPYSEKGAPSGVASLDASGYLPWAQAPRSYYSATPPASPRDGDEWVFPADAAAGVNWRFRYNAGSGSIYKWEFIGGPPLDASRLAADSMSVTPTYTNLPNGPTLTVPRTGDYIVEFVLNMTGAPATPHITTVVVSPVTGIASNAAGPASTSVTVSFTFALFAAVGLTVGTILQLQAGSGQANGWSMSNRAIKITPRRVS